MTSIELVCMNIGESVTVKPLMKLGGLDLGGVVLTLVNRGGNISTFVATYLGVRIGNPTAYTMNDDVDWSWN